MSQSRMRSRSPDHLDLGRDLPEFPFLRHLESPDSTTPATAHSVLVRGWIIIPAHLEMHGMWVEQAGARSSLELYARLDVEGVFGVDPAVEQAIGFRGLVTVQGTDSIDLIGHVGTTTYRDRLAVMIDAPANDRFIADKARKLYRIAPLLRCPSSVHGPRGPERCGGELEHSSTEMVCLRCGEKFRHSEAAFDFLTDEMRDIGGVEETTNISDHGYDGLADELVELCGDGLVLDAGAGLKHQYHPNIVNVEIADYATTDVRALCERLPFETASFDGAMSLAVLEHVRDPFAAAREIARVVKPGGRLYVSVPFLQPYHGYPHHYYNMTQSGLVQLFEEAFEIEDALVPTYGHPIWTMTWFIRRYLEGLPEETARELGEMRLAELTGSGYDYLDAKYVSELSAEANVELASSTAIIARRR